jgi:hypothetical protein
MGCLNISIIDDADQEMTEEFNATVVVIQVYSLYQCTPVLIRITDNDGIVICSHSLCKTRKMNTISQGFLCDWFLLHKCMEKL